MFAVPCLSYLRVLLGGLYQQKKREEQKAKDTTFPLRLTQIDLQLLTRLLKVGPFKRITLRTNFLCPKWRAASQPNPESSVTTHSSRAAQKASHSQVKGYIIWWKMFFGLQTLAFIPGCAAAATVNFIFFRWINQTNARSAVRCVVAGQPDGPEIRSSSFD